ncbi:hypothetical protein EVAR_93253_1 [Eumeta japonica]|uniref:Uncharacterized protein n=1 Tax=Eumeta variegata TaxID=151549 RepID=A0A4C1TXQ4_EUMVA|nr:hypothetical protein EVAR_93253_1 [Eumeta japonica]
MTKENPIVRSFNILDNADGPSPQAGPLAVGERARWWSGRGRRGWGRGARAARADMSRRRRRPLRSRLRAALRWLLAFLFTNVGVVLLVLGYTIAASKIHFWTISIMLRVDRALASAEAGRYRARAPSACKSLRALLPRAPIHK